MGTLTRIKNRMSAVIPPGEQAEFFEGKEAGGSPVRTNETLDLRHITFDPNTPELQTTWSSSARMICCINVFPNGITFSVHSNEPAEGALRDGSAPRFLPNQFHLRLRDTRDYQLAAGKYFLFKERYAEALEHQLSLLHKQGVLSMCVCYLGVTADPFLAFHKKFDVTMKCIELLETYQPGFLVVQTRSPMVISALPILKLFGDRAVVALTVETPAEKEIVRYAPGQPSIADRIAAADGLRHQGIKVNLVASPVLPYGDFYHDAWRFAELLVEHGDYVTFGCLASGAAADESELKTLPIARKLVADRNYRWLRPHSYRYLYYAVQSIDREKLVLPVRTFPKPSQLSLFAAA